MTVRAIEYNLNLSDIPVAQEFPKLFPDDLPGVPPDREIELLDKGFIRPSFSP